MDEAFDHAFFIGSSCAFGVFDGVHVGHRFLLAQAMRTARAQGGISIALTFDIDPDEVFHPRRLKKLMANDERLLMLSSTGVDAVVVLPFTHALSMLSPEGFLGATFGGQVPAHLHVGHDFHFGAHAVGTIRDLEAWGQAGGTHIDAHDLKSEEGAPVTATRIRLLLADGDIAEANRLLSRPYFMMGKVQSGRGEGAELGFRTANLMVPDQLRALRDGVYAAWATVGGRRYRAAVNVGVAASFAERATATCEVHLLDFEGDVYGACLKVEFMHWLRPMKKFSSVEELIATVKNNITWVREHL